MLTDVPKLYLFMHRRFHNTKLKPGRTVLCQNRMIWDLVLCCILTIRFIWCKKKIKIKTVIRSKIKIFLYMNFRRKEKGFYTWVYVQHLFCSTKNGCFTELFEKKRKISRTTWKLFQKANNDVIKIHECGQFRAVGEAYVCTNVCCLARTLFHSFLSLAHSQAVISCLSQSLIPPHLSH